jgi:hypothetical protein
MAGRPRKATAILEASGAFLRHPERRRAREKEPKPNAPLGEPPKRLPPNQRSIWRELLLQITPGVAKISDRLLFEVLVVLTNRFREGCATPTELRLITSIATKFGLSPADRSRVAVSDNETSAESRGLEIFRKQVRRERRRNVQVQ